MPNLAPVAPTIAADGPADLHAPAAALALIPNVELAATAVDPPFPVAVRHDFHDSEDVDGKVAAVIHGARGDRRDPDHAHEVENAHDGVLIGQMFLQRDPMAFDSTLMLVVDFNPGRSCRVAARAR